jgi:hypothetical protein
MESGLNDTARYDIAKHGQLDAPTLDARGRWRLLAGGMRMAIRLSRFTGGPPLSRALTELESGVDIERGLSIILGRRFEYADPTPQELSPWLGWLPRCAPSAPDLESADELIRGSLEGYDGPGRRLWLRL